MNEAYHDNMTATCGPLYPYADYTVGETIRYQQAGQLLTGEIVWIVGPEQVGSTHTPLTYLVMPEGMDDTIPDLVWSGDILIDPSYNLM